MNGPARERILRAALACFSADGVAGTTLSRLREAAGVSPGAFYHHFPGKEEVAAALFVDIVTGYQQDFLEELRRHTDPEEAVKAIVAFHVRWCGEHPEESRFLFTERSPSSHELQRKNKAYFGEVSAWWGSHAYHGAVLGLDIVTLYVLWLGPAQELCRAWLSNSIPPPTQEQVDVLAEAAWKSVRAPEKGAEA